ncbi:MAG: YceI family protein [Bacteroidetes bacterium]|jgi:polyisoprenoid-binding protein YceI|nr:YceI family protein [Bacteroidota bacterium]
MKKITLLAATMVLSIALFAQTKWQVDKAHAKVGFTVTHLSLSEVDGNFKKFDASITSSKPDFSDAVFEMSTDVASVSTDNDMRDNHIKSPDFFDAAKFPQITFKSKSITKIDDKKYKLTGDLTMHGITKQVDLDLTLNGVGKDMRTQKPIAGFKVTGTINRNDFGVGHMPAAVVSEEIQIRANGEFGQI